MTKQSERLRKEGKINTQQAMNVVSAIRGKQVYKQKYEDLKKRLRNEVPNEKYGEGKGSYYYFKVDDLIEFGNRLKKEDLEEAE